MWKVLGGIVVGYVLAAMVHRGSLERTLKSAESATARAGSQAWAAGQRALAQRRARGGTSGLRGCGCGVM